MPKGVHLGRGTKACAICNTEFTYALSRFQAKYCSEPCRKIGQQAKQKNPRICIGCGISYFPRAHNPGKGFHSISCYQKNQAKRADRELSWRNWEPAKAFLLNTIGHCEQCHWKEEPCVLELHHIDRNRHHNKRENLLLLCRNCHAIIHWKAKDGQYRSFLGRKRA